MININTLNPEQKEAVKSFFGPTMILAGAGTGKTRVVTFRIAYMLEQGVDPGKIVALTFTNKAAKEMQERISSLVGVSTAKKLLVSTFHSFCLKLLRSYGEVFGVPKKFTLIGTSDQIDLLRRCLEEKKWSGLYRADQLHAQIGQCKNQLISPSDLKESLGENLRFSGDVDVELLSEVYKLYERQLELNRAIDFDDCIYKVVKVLQNNSSLKEFLQHKYQYYLVDEFQDTNASQFAALEQLVGSDHNICVVGDDDQSIYSWRGAMYETLERFEHTFKGTKIIKLEQNYRCSNVILNAANTLIKNNPERKSKTLWSDSKEQRPIIMSANEDSTAEARWVAEKCLALVGRGYRLNEIALLYRTNTQSKLIEMALRECRLHYKTYGGQSFFERKEVKDFLCYIRLLVNPDDHLSLWRVINVPNRGIGLKTQEQIEKLARTLECSPYEALKKAELEDLLSPRAYSAVKGFVELIEIFRQLPLTSSDDCIALGEKVLSQSGLLEHVKAGAKNYHAQQHKSNSLKSLPEWIGRVAKDYESQKGEVDCVKLLDALTLGDEQSHSKDDEASCHISLMTIHRSKGLEFPAVFVTGLEEGVLPHKNSLNEGEMQIYEERRLFYVAMTRAKRELFISYAKMRQNGFQKERRKTSRFLAELPSNANILMSGSIEEKEQIKTTKAQTLGKLSALRSSLK